jgi:anti-sigma B factor antagonist
VTSSRPVGPQGTIGLVVTHPADGVHVLHVDGELDTVTAPALAESLREQLSSGCQSLVIDLAAVEFLGSSGLAALAEALELAGDTTKLVLAGTANHLVARPLEITGMTSLFDVYPTVPDALAALETPAS